MSEFCCAAYVACWLPAQSGHTRDVCYLSASLIGRQAQALSGYPHTSVDVAHGLALFFGRGDRSLHQCLTRFASTISSLKLNTFGSLGSTIARTQCVSG